MRIALVSTCAVAVPPAAYGGTEAFVATLGRALVEAGHEVRTYATGDSRPAGELRYRFERAAWPPDYTAEARHASFAAGDARRFEPDVVHLNSPDALAAFADCEAPVVVTLHHAREEPLLAAYLAAPHAHRVAISRRQASLFPELAPFRVIHHGLDPRLHPRGAGRGGYCAFLGRIGPEKAPHLAIDAAVRAGVRLVLGGPHWNGTPRYDEYYAREFEPRLRAHAPLVDWHGELSFDAKRSLLAGAAALLFPMGWEEPFGLAMIEAMLAGTPVVAFDRGAAPEIVEDGITGFLVRDADGMARRIADAMALDRERCRARALERFCARRMADEYVALYHGVAMDTAAAP